MTNETTDAAASRLEEALGHRFADRALLLRALTHASWANEHPDRPPHNETMEFLGDGLLGFLVGELLLEAFPGAPEGVLTRLRAQLVSAPAFARKAAELGVGEALRLSPGEERAGGRKRQGLLSDAFEALVAAVYLDAGFPAAREVVRRVLGAEAAALRPEGALADDAKTALQQRLQAAGCRLPAYRVVRREGPSHRPRFTVEVSCEGEPPASGEGTSRKSAEQEAARSLLARLEERDGEGA
ncbi:MAG: ribonuclease III [Acidobacteria bacterium]|nr:MAG: ribonuclease III [Acidobacteriota bacterium]